MASASPEEDDKPLVWLHGEIRTPPFSTSARIEAGVLLRRLQRGEMLSMPHMRPMPSLGPRCYELRIPDEDNSFRIFLRIDPDAIPILDVDEKKSRKTPKETIDVCQLRLRRYDKAVQEAQKAAKPTRKGK